MVGWRGADDRRRRQGLGLGQRGEVREQTGLEQNRAGGTSIDIHLEFTDSDKKLTSNNAMNVNLTNH